MSFGILTFLQGMSPWWWVAFALTLGALEMLSMAFFLIGPALAALLMSIILVAFPEMPGTVQLALFGVLSVLLTLGFKSQRHLFQQSETPNSLNDRTARMVGKRGKVISFHHGTGSIEVEGIHWQAKADPTALGLKAGALVEVEGVEDGTLVIRRLAQE